MMMSGSVDPTSAEITRALPGDDLVPHPDTVMDRAFTLPAPCEEVWPWINQLGKNRAGWYAPAWLEKFVPPRRRGLRRIETSLQNLAAGDVIGDWGGRDATFEIVVHQPPHVLVHRSTRGRLRISWTIILTDESGRATRVHLRFRINGVRHRRLVECGGGLIDFLTIAALAAGLRERLTHRALR
ncbi:hypothetical protein ACFWC5_14055 [Streptomyces sp. NPDC060085]|uniref:hypothetical protein n=1 Tax=Streptomyces sp. NPDC060085 TaxID=3347054 RepID=UPI0036532E20